MLFQIHSRHGSITLSCHFLCWKFHNFTEPSRRTATYQQKENRITWNEEQENRHKIRVNKGDPQPPLESDGRKNKTKWRAASSPFGAPKRKLNPSDRDMSVKVGSGKIADLTRVEWVKLSSTAAGTRTRQTSKRYFPTVKVGGTLRKNFYSFCVPLVKVYPK